MHFHAGFCIFGCLVRTSSSNLDDSEAVDQFAPLSRGSKRMVNSEGSCTCFRIPPLYDLWSLYGWGNRDGVWGKTSQYTLYSHGLEPLWVQEKTVVLFSNLSRATWSGQERRLKLLETCRPRCGNCESTPMVCCYLLLAVTFLFWRKMACHPSASSTS